MSLRIDPPQPLVGPVADDPDRSFALGHARERFTEVAGAEPLDARNLDGRA